MAVVGICPATFLVELMSAGEEEDRSACAAAAGFESASV